MDLKNKSTEELHNLKKQLESEIATENNQQMALKILMNAEYGALANQYFRYFDPRLASAITLCGQLAIRWIEKYLMEHPLQKKYKWEVIYEDTDSVYMSFKYLAEKLIKKFGDDEHLITEKINKFSLKVIQPIIDKGYEELAEYVNANENRMFMKQEKISTKGLWTGKKKYALLVLDNEGVLYKEPTLKVKGIETVRASTPQFVREKLEKILTIILTDPDSLSDFIDETRKEFMKLDAEDTAFSVSVNTLNKYETIVDNGNPLFEDDMFDEDEYSELGYKKRTPIGVRAAIVHNKYIIKNDLFRKIPEIKVGEKIKFLYMKEPNPLHENIIGFTRLLPERDKLVQFVDFNTQFYKTFLRPIENITEKIKMIIKDNKDFDINTLF